MKSLDFKNNDLLELSVESMSIINGGDSSNYWYALASEAAAGVEKFVDGVGEGFKAGVEAWGKFL